MAQMDNYALCASHRPIHDRSHRRYGMTLFLHFLLRCLLLRAQAQHLSFHVHGRRLKIIHLGTQLSHLLLTLTPFHRCFRLVLLRGCSRMHRRQGTREHKQAACRAHWVQTIRINQSCIQCIVQGRLWVWSLLTGKCFTNMQGTTAGMLYY